ncbi:hypothetical protein JB92DRAFT_1529594 [Gautieria morchelliformis]|nr:hypothetical protein JB92DRAFT_1529594 [Gautieria morchelliformis]
MPGCTCGRLSPRGCWLDALDATAHLGKPGIAICPCHQDATLLRRIGPRTYGHVRVRGLPQGRYPIVPESRLHVLPQACELGVRSAQAQAENRPRPSRNHSGRASTELRLVATLFTRGV